MSKLLTALIAIGFSVGLNVTMAQNVDSEKDKAHGQANGEAAKDDPSNPQKEQSGVNNQNDAPQPGQAQGANTAKDCATLSGKEKDKCIQATPAGPVDTTTGQGSKAKSATAKERDREKAQSPTDSAAPVQSNSSLGHPDKGQSGAATGGGDQSGDSNKTLSGKNIPAQSKDSVGHPEQRATTGEAQTLEEPGPSTGSNANQNPASGAQTDKTQK